MLTQTCTPNTQKAVWWVRAAALALGGEADYDRSKDKEGFHELWFTIPAENMPEDELERPACADGGGSLLAAEAKGEVTVEGTETLANGLDAKDTGDSRRTSRSSHAGEAGKGESVVSLVSLQAGRESGSVAAEAVAAEDGIDAWARGGAAEPSTFSASAGAGAVGFSVCLRAIPDRQQTRENTTVFTRRG